MCIINIWLFIRANWFPDATLALEGQTEEPLRVREIFFVKLVSFQPLFFSPFEKTNQGNLHISDI